MMLVTNLIISQVSTNFYHCGSFASNRKPSQYRITVVFSPSFSENQSQTPASFAQYALRHKFYQIFSHSWDFIAKETPESQWKSVKKYKLTEQKLSYKYSDPNIILGVRFGTETTHGLYDLDWGSIYDPREQEESLRLLKGELELWGIFRFVLLQSSLSQGLHLYFFLDRPVNTFRLACVMNKAAEDAGLEIKRGQLETFPNTKRYNSLFNGHRLPLQQGSCLLDLDYTPVSDLLEDFLDAADWSAAGNDVDLLESRLNEAYEWFKTKKNQQRIYNPTPEDKDFLEQVDYAQREIKEGFLNHIRIRIEQGFSGEHETNELLLTIGKLARLLHGLSGNKLIQYIRETIFTCPGYAKYCRHKREIHRRCEEVARFSEKQWYPYRSRLPQDRPTYKYIKDALTNKTNLNQERQHNASSRVEMAVDHIEREEGGLPKKVGECKLLIRNITKKLFGISVSDATLTKPENLPLWHPKHRKAEPNPKPTAPPQTEPQHPAEEEVIVTSVAEEVKEQETTETPTPVQEESWAEVSPDPWVSSEAAPSSSSPNNTVEQNNDCEGCSLTESISKQESVDLEISNAIDIPQEDSEPNVIQEALHTKQPQSKEHKAYATPCHVICQNDQNQKTPKCILSLVHTILCHTLPLMKGTLPFFLVEFIYQLLQRTYFSFLMGTPRLELSYQGYREYAARGLITRQGQQQAKVELIPIHTEVEVLREDYHSFCYRDNPKQLLVYIKPLENAEDWLNGISVLVENLVPLRIRDQISLNNQKLEKQSDLKET